MRNCVLFRGIKKCLPTSLYFCLWVFPFLSILLYFGGAFGHYYLWVLFYFSPISANGRQYDNSDSNMQLAVEQPFGENRIFMTFCLWLVFFFRSRRISGFQLSRGNRYQRGGLRGALGGVVSCKPARLEDAKDVGDWGWGWDHSIPKGWMKEKLELGIDFWRCVSVVCVEKQSRLKLICK